MWNLESWALESGIQLNEPGIYAPLTENLESSAWNPESLPWTPESKTILDSPTWEFADTFDNGPLFTIIIIIIIIII